MLNERVASATISRMTATAEKIKSQLLILSPKERAELAHFLIVSLDSQADKDAESAWDAELERRAEQIRIGVAKGEPAEKVFAELRAKYS